MADTPEPSAVASPAPAPEGASESAPASADSTAPSAQDATPAAAGETIPEPAPAADGPRYFRDDRRAEIGRRMREKRAADRADPSLSAARESVETALSDATPAQPVNASPADTGEATLTAASPATPAPTPTEPAAFETVTVNGLSFDVPRAEIEAAGGKAAYQMARAAEISLRNVQRIESETRARAMQPPAAAPTAPTPASASGRPAPAPTAASETELAQELLDGVLESNAEAIARTLGKIRATAPLAPQPSVPASTPARTAARSTRSQAEIDAANAIYDRDFAALRQVEGADALVLGQVQTRMNDPRFATVPLDIILREAATNVAKLRGLRVGPVTPPSPATTTALDQRRAAKARLPISSSAGTRVPQAAASPPATRESRTRDYIAQLRARSGSNTAMAERAARR